MFMYHKDNSMIPNRYQEGWKAVIAPTAGEVAQICSKYVCSPCIWSHGVRKKANFRMAEWIGLDFDEGMSLEEAKETFEPYIHVIGTTRSHQKEKGGKVCDRFRVFLRLSDRCQSIRDYEATADMLVKKYGADPAAKDGARLFWPCNEIIAYKFYGVTLHVVETVEIQKKTSAHQKKMMNFYQRNKRLPPWFERAAIHGVVNRQAFSFRSGTHLGKIGFTEDEIVKLIMGSNIPTSSPSRFDEAECRRAVRNGLKAV